MFQNDFAHKIKYFKWICRIKILDFLSVAFFRWKQQKCWEGFFTSQIHFSTFSGQLSAFLLCAVPEVMFYFAVITQYPMTVLIIPLFKDALPHSYFTWKIPLSANIGNWLLSSYNVYQFPLECLIMVDCSSKPLMPNMIQISTGFYSS